MSERKPRETGRGGRYSNRVHSMGEMSRRELRRLRKLELKQGLNSSAAENPKANQTPIEMEPGEDYLIE